MTNQLLVFTLLTTNWVSIDLEKSPDKRPKKEVGIIIENKFAEVTVDGITNKILISQQISPVLPSIRDWTNVSWSQTMTNIIYRYTNGYYYLERGDTQYKIPVTPTAELNDFGKNL